MFKCRVFLTARRSSNHRMQKECVPTCLATMQSNTDFLVHQFVGGHVVVCKEESSYYQSDVILQCWLSLRQSYRVVSFKANTPISSYTKGARIPCGYLATRERLCSFDVST